MFYIPPIHSGFYFYTTLLCIMCISMYHFYLYEFFSLSMYIHLYVCVRVLYVLSDFTKRILYSFVLLPLSFSLHSQFKWLYSFAFHHKTYQQRYFRMNTPTPSSCSTIHSHSHIPNCQCVPLDDSWSFRTIKYGWKNSHFTHSMSVFSIYVTV